MDIFEKIEGHIFGEIFKEGGIFLWVIFQGNWGRFLQKIKGYFWGKFLKGTDEKLWGIYFLGKLKVNFEGD